MQHSKDFTQSNRKIVYQVRKGPISKKFFNYFSGNATRQCSLDGVWEEKGHYDDCIPVQLPPDGPGPCENSTIPLCNDYSMLIYSIGYSLSLITLLMALIIFISFR